MSRKGYLLLLPVVGVTGMLLGAFLHGRYAETEPSKATMEAAAIANARETARLQFERDIGLAEAQLRSARETMEQLTNRPGSNGLSPETLGEDVQQKLARVAFLRSEARRLNIPVPPAEEDSSESVTAQQIDQVHEPISEAVPSVITLTEPVEFRDPKSLEVITFGRGRTFRVVNSSGDAVRVRHLEQEISIPVSATDLTARR